MSTSLDIILSASNSEPVTNFPETNADPGFTGYLEFWTLAVVLSSIAYGIVFTLFVTTFQLLRKSSTEPSQKGLHRTLCAYITMMFALSTVSIVYNIWTSLKAIKTQTVPRNILLGASPDAVVTMLAIWASDGFLLWRGSILYGGISKGKRRAAYGLIIFLIAAQIVTGIFYILSNFVSTVQLPERALCIAFASATLCVNWVITGLIVIRLLVFRISIRKTLGSSVHGLPYIGIITMCIESAALEIVFATIFLILNLLNLYPFSLSRALLVHIYVIAPLLTIYRVAQGKAFINDSRSFYSETPEISQCRPAMTCIYFHDDHAPSTIPEPSISSILDLDIRNSHSGDLKRVEASNIQGDIAMSDKGVCVPRQ